MPSMHFVVSLSSHLFVSQFDTTAEHSLNTLAISIPNIEQQRGQKTLKGKQVMMGYNKLLQERLHAEEYDIACETLVSTSFTFSHL